MSLRKGIIALVEVVETCVYVYDMHIYAKYICYLIKRLYISSFESPKEVNGNIEFHQSSLESQLSTLLTENFVFDFESDT